MHWMLTILLILAAPLAASAAWVTDLTITDGSPGVTAAYRVTRASAGGPETVVVDNLAVTGATQLYTDDGTSPAGPVTENVMHTYIVYALGPGGPVASDPVSGIPASVAKPGLIIQFRWVP